MSYRNQLKKKTGINLQKKDKLKRSPLVDKLGQSLLHVAYLAKPRKENQNTASLRQSHTTIVVSFAAY